MVCALIFIVQGNNPNNHLRNYLLRDCLQRVGSKGQSYSVTWRLWCDCVTTESLVSCPVYLFKNINVTTTKRWFYGKLRSCSYFCQPLSQHRDFLESLLLFLSQPRVTLECWGVGWRAGRPNLLSGWGCVASFHTWKSKLAVDVSMCVTGFTQPLNGWMDMNEGISQTVILSL